MKHILLVVLFSIVSLSQAQDRVTVISLAEYLAYVKKFHPIVKQANLIINQSEAKLLKARGAFDPKLEVDYNQKKFKSTEYYNKLNAAFKIPTWYGVELKGSFEENDGVYLNPEATLPNEGLYSVGLSVSLAKGLLINKRMATLKQSKIFVKQALADRQLYINNILYQATLTYFNWLKTYNEKQVYEDFLVNAETRFKGIKKSYAVGETAAIDTIEARIALNDRKLNLEKSKIKFIKSSLELSNYLWINENTPIEIKNNVIPEVNTLQSIDLTLNTSALDIENFNLKNHPKLQSLDYKLQGLDIERRLKLNNLLPKIDLQYNFLSQTPEITNSFNTNAYKSGVNISFPLFLRKERADLKLAKLKMENTQFEIKSEQVSLKNKIEAISQELKSFTSQNAFTQVIVNDYDTMLKAEERKFLLGESSLFLINSRESKLISAKLKAISLENAFFNTKANLFNILATLYTNIN